MANITLVGERWAVEGEEFIYLGPCPECKDCKVRTVCFNLQEGRRYRIMEIRDTKHPCKMHEGGVVAVEYEMLPIQVAVETVKAMEGAVITFDNVKCGVKACQHKRICSQGLIKNGIRIKLVSMGAQMECVEGKKMVVVETKEV